ncbi:cobalamin-5'-phosphate synthase [Rhodovulum sp. ES.010]|uniref:adenosylcobinamide-GDP ribazoletransferase n=1 Tax=Rhodovulum sp. ES.010 TaxID=1882821 RepID=UPI00092AABD5|nr:adenosylcobinamide-GDP ribazoletransferase [Rhodovulum sp. ES.010]SIO28589.1 cobalamin-5'-phosphate synthase [Rhodovulum sp. ES.010]
MDASDRSDRRPRHGLVAGLAEETRLALLAVQFLTRVPVPAADIFTPERMSRAVRYFPLVGLALGAVLGAVLALGSAVFPPVVAALLAVALGVRLTGALHEDGLADLADGLGGADTRERALEIMRDSRIGSYGTLALGLVMALKVAALAHMGVAVGAWALVAAHGLSRVASLILMLRLPYAREEGKAGFASPGAGRGPALIAAGTVVLALLAVAATAGAGAAVSAAIATAAVTAWMGTMLVRRLAGHTGDALGAVQQLSETAVLLAVLAWV